ncbi:predicted protein [Uncinocarpus reesii 1704]|uniref:Uncharacterized protein n=1 Tax=Uncinocarpus reesii (strain UAMH 1704) TaxID=336963 RepID=C4JR85_UNCRE|nr:uncharacterized protein UREG_03567 [Uncinocarpus reesii 1704]EEP78721.1 predicted protein [Uncinocarpus reesii 1704]
MDLRAPSHRASTGWSPKSSSPVDTRAPIERLPVELIHKIFFQSLEFNFPRASIHVAAALANEVIYSWLIRLAFSSNNPSSSSGILIRPFVPMSYFSIGMKERTDLQTEILRCRWCTISLMRKCQREYVEHVLRQKCRDLVMSDADRAQLDNLDDYWQNIDPFDNATHGKRGKGDLVLSARHPQSDVNLKVSIWFNFGAVQIREPSPVFQETDVFRLPACSLTDPCRMPDRLLRTPWTEEKLELLTLLSNEAYIDDDGNFERSKAVVRQLIVDRDFATFQRLLSLHIRVKIYSYPLRWPVRSNNFRVAARYAKSDKDPFLTLLFSEHRDEIPTSDKSIRALLAKYEQS